MQSLARSLSLAHSPTQIAPSSSPPNPILRRELAFSSLLLFVIGPLNQNPSRATALPDITKIPSKKLCPNQDQIDPSKEAFLDVSIDGEPVGRIVIGLYNETVPAGSSRFRALANGEAGVSYRRKEFVKIIPNYVQHSGIRSYGVDAEIARKRTGSALNADRLVEELEKQSGNCDGTKNVAKSVSIIVRDPTKVPPKVKLMARQGKLEFDEEGAGKEPNGTEFVIALTDSPELDASALVVGRVTQGMDVVEMISRVKTVQENTSSPYLRVAKLIGDKRAVVAERGFNRPYSKVVITNCGLLDNNSPSQDVNS